MQLMPTEHELRAEELIAIKKMIALKCRCGSLGNTIVTHPPLDCCQFAIHDSIQLLIFERSDRRVRIVGLLKIFVSKGFVNQANKTINSEGFECEELLSRFCWQC